MLIPLERLLCCHSGLFLLDGLLEFVLFDFLPKLVQGLSVLSLDLPLLLLLQGVHVLEHLVAQVLALQGLLLPCVQLVLLFLEGGARLPNLLLVEASLNLHFLVPVRLLLPNLHVQRLPNLALVYFALRKTFRFFFLSQHLVVPLDLAPLVLTYV